MSRSLSALLTKTMICAIIFEKNSDSVLQSAKKAIEMGADILEFRIDVLENPDPETVQRLIYEIDYPIIATNRMQEEGGFFNGSEKERIEILLKAAKYAQFVDIELQTDEKYLSQVIEASNSSIVSYHDFERTPPFEELTNVVKMQREIGDIAKFAVMPNSLQDTLTVLKVLSNVENTIGIAMGDLGRYTRVVAPLFGSPITYASVNNKSAPGQLDISSIKNILRILEVMD